MAISIPYSCIATVVDDVRLLCIATVEPQVGEWATSIIGPHARQTHLSACCRILSAYAQKCVCACVPVACGRPPVSTTDARLACTISYRYPPIDGYKNRRWFMPLHTSQCPCFLVSNWRIESACTWHSLPALESEHTKTLCGALVPPCRTLGSFETVVFALSGWD